jgi:hypothetical protein
VDIDANTKKVVDTDSVEDIDSKIKEKELELERINDYNAEDEVGGYGLLP